MLAQLDSALLESFNFHFDITVIKTLDFLRAAQRLRYQVYCVEHPYEEDVRFDGIESDEFDACATHALLTHRASDTALGTVRLILPSGKALESRFPAQRLMDESTLRSFNKLPLRTTAEVSRFSISKHYRQVARSSDNSRHAAFISNSGALLRLGLIQSLVRMSRHQGITHWCAILEPTLLRLLSAMAIRFRVLGPPIAYHGQRHVSYCIIEDMLDDVRRERPAFYSILTDGGTLER